MKVILLFGAGKSATVLIDYLIENSITENWKVVIVDADLKLLNRKLAAHNGPPLFRLILIMHQKE